MALQCEKLKMQTSHSTSWSIDYICGEGEMVYICFCFVFVFAELLEDITGKDVVVKVFS